MRSCTFSRNFLGSKVRIYIGLYAITNNYCVARVRNDFYLPATLIQRYSTDYAVLISKAGMQKWLLRSLVQGTYVLATKRIRRIQ